MVECCFTSTETVGLLGTGAQDVHLDVHTAPELCRDLTESDSVFVLFFFYAEQIIATDHISCNRKLPTDQLTHRDWFYSFCLAQRHGCVKLFEVPAITNQLNFTIRAIDSEFLLE